MFFLVILFHEQLFTFSKSWKCNGGFCQQTESSTEGYYTQELCEMVCSSYLNIWPKPTGGLTSLKNLVNINSRYVSIIEHKVQKFKK